MITLVTILSQRLFDNHFQLGRHVVIEASDRFRLRVRDAVDCFRKAGAIERHASRRHLIKYNAEAEDVCAMIHIAAHRLLRRHVVDRAHDDARTGFDFRGEFTLWRHISPRRNAAQLRQSKVEHLHFRIGRNDDVLWLDVAMRDAF